MMSMSDSCKDSVCDVNNMSTADNDDDNIVSVCANCGKGEEETSKLKNCTACKMVKYCSRECQIAHRPQHKKECKKRAAELHDIELFKQPPPAEDCPICFEQLPLLNTGKRYQSCCGKFICCGCGNAPVYDDQGNKLEKTCPFCRTPYNYSEKETVERNKKRVELGDPIAIYNEGCCYTDGTDGFPQDYSKALELFHRAAELGYATAYNDIGYAYSNGEGVEVDKKKANHYYELAAIAGIAVARYNLGMEEGNVGNMDRSVKHHLIAVRSGSCHSLEKIKQLYSNGQATKDDYAKALQSYQTYLSEIKSDQRDKAFASSESYRYY